MATQVSQGKQAANARHESYVAAQLRRVEARIRGFDLATAFFGFVALTCGYAVAMILLDRQLELAASVRQSAFWIYVVGAAAYLWFLVVRPLYRRINPYYAAKHLEETLPEAKNSVINWLDLQNENLPPAVRGAVGQRAARDIARTDLDEAVSGQSAGWSAALAAILFVSFATLFILFGPRQFFSLLRRSFLPFDGSTAISTRTTIQVVRPEGGHAALPIGRSLTIAAEVGGREPDPRKPDAVRLLMRYQADDPYLERPLIRELGREWQIVVPANDVQNGFYYKIAGGDAETPEYRVTVRSTPLLSDFKATYRYPAYAGRSSESRRERKIEAVRGTEVVLRVKTNRAVKEAAIDFETEAGRSSLPAESLPGELNGFLIRFRLNDSGNYRLRYTSSDDESYIDPLSFPMVASPDKPPVVELTRPGRDIALPANGLLQVEGQASDDFGVKSLVLQMRIKDGDRLESQPYRDGKALTLPGGGHPLSVSYKDFVDLQKVKSAGGKPQQLVPGMVVEYWLEASDACDQPEPNVAESKHYLVVLTEPEANPEKQRQDREQAAQDQDRHEQKQDEQMQQEGKARQDEAKRQAEEEKNDAGENGAAKPSDPKEGGEPGDQNQPQPMNGKGEPKQQPNGGDGDPMGDPGQAPMDKELQDKQKRLQEAIEKREREKNQVGGNEKPEPKNDGGEPKDGKDPKEKSGEPKERGPMEPMAGDRNDPADGKKDPGDKGMNRGDKPQTIKDGEPKGEDKGDPRNENRPGDNKDQGKPEGKPDRGEGKPEAKPDAGDKPDQKGEKAGDPKGGQPDPKNAPADGKPQGGDGPMQDGKAAPKDGQPMPQPGNEPGMGKDDAAQAQKPQQAEGKGGQPMAREPAGEEKNAGKQPEQGEARGGEKDAGKTQPGGEQAKQQPADGKGKPENAQKADGKAGGPEPGAEPQQGKAEPKDGGDPMAAPMSERAGQKPAGNAKDGTSQAKGDPKAADAEERRREMAREKDQLAKLRRDLQSKDPAQRDEARRKLDDLARNANDPKVREEAGKELGKDGQPMQTAKGDKPEDQPGQLAKDGQNPSDKGDSVAQAKDNKPGQDGEKGEPGNKPGDTKPGQKPGQGQGQQKGDQADAKDAGNERGEPGDGNKGDAKAEGMGGGQKGDGDNVAEAKDRKGSDGAGNQPGGGRDGDRGAARDTGEPDQPALNEAGRFKNRGGVLQLEDFKKKVDKKVLDDAGMTEAEYREFLKAYEEALKRQQAEAGRETPAVPQSGGALPSASGRRVVGQEKNSDVKGAGPARKAPPGYDDAYREFTRRLAQPTD